MKKDKVIHFCAGAMVAILIGLPVYFESKNLFCGLWAAIFSGLIAAGTKELCDDNTPGNNWDTRDFLATMAGVAVVVVFIIVKYFIDMHTGRG